MIKYAIGISLAMVGIIAMAYDNLEYKGYGDAKNCTGECYRQFVEVNGTAFEIERAKQLAAADDRFSDIRSLWTGCAACHGAQGQGGIGPMLAGQSADDIISKLTTYKNNGTVGPQSAMMWAQAAQLTEGQIGTIGVFVQEGFPNQ